MDESNLKNNLGQPIGEIIPNWSKRLLPSHTNMEGQYCSINILNVNDHADELFKAFAEDFNNQDWTYLPYGPFENLRKFLEWLQKECIGNDPLFHTILDKTINKAVGMASYLRINPDQGVIEVGHIHFSPCIQKSSIGTEAMYLMMKRVFDELKYRRYEWKCNALNINSCNAARRLGFKFEGIFRQHMISKGHNRDTAWFAILDKDWLKIKNNFEKWLDKNNFNEDGNQKVSLSSLMSVSS